MIILLFILQFCCTKVNSECAGCNENLEASRWNNFFDSAHAAKEIAKRETSGTQISSMQNDAIGHFVSCNSKEMRVALTFQNAFRGKVYTLEAATRCSGQGNDGKMMELTFQTNKCGIKKTGNLLETTLVVEMPIEGLPSTLINLTCPIEKEKLVLKSGEHGVEPVLPEQNPNRPFILNTCSKKGFQLNVQFQSSFVGKVYTSTSSGTCSFEAEKRRSLQVTIPYQSCGSFQKDEYAYNVLVVEHKTQSAGFKYFYNMGCQPKTLVSVNEVTIPKFKSTIISKKFTCLADKVVATLEFSESFTGKVETVQNINTCNYKAVGEKSIVFTMTFDTCAFTRSGERLAQKLNIDYMNGFQEYVGFSCKEQKFSNITWVNQHSYRLKVFPQISYLCASDGIKASIKFPSPFTGSINSAGSQCNYPVDNGGQMTLDLPYSGCGTTKVDNVYKNTLLIGCGGIQLSFEISCQKVVKTTSIYEVNEIEVTSKELIKKADVYGVCLNGGMKIFVKFQQAFLGKIFTLASKTGRVACELTVDNKKGSTFVIPYDKCGTTTEESIYRNSIAIQSTTYTWRSVYSFFCQNPETLPVEATGKFLERFDTTTTTTVYMGSVKETILVSQPIESNVKCAGERVQVFFKFEKAFSGEIFSSLNAVDNKCKMQVSDKTDVEVAFPLSDCCTLENGISYRYNISIKYSRQEVVSGYKMFYAGQCASKPGQPSGDVPESEGGLGTGQQKPKGGSEGKFPSRPDDNEKMDQLSPIPPDQTIPGEDIPNQGPTGKGPKTGGRGTPGSSETSPRTGEKGEGEMGPGNKGGSTPKTFVGGSGQGNARDRGTPNTGEEGNGVLIPGRPNRPKMGGHDKSKPDESGPRTDTRGPGGMIPGDNLPTEQGGSGPNKGGPGKPSKPKTGGKGVPGSEDTSPGEGEHGAGGMGQGDNTPNEQGGTGPNKGSPGKPSGSKPKTGGKGVPGSEETSPGEGEHGAGGMGPGDNTPNEQGGTGPNKGSPGKPTGSKPKTGGKGVPGSEDTSPGEGEHGAGGMIPGDNTPNEQGGTGPNKGRPGKPNGSKPKTGGKGVPGSEETSPGEGEIGAGGMAPGDNIPTDQGGTGPNKGRPGKPSGSKPKTGGKGVPGSEETSPGEGEIGAGGMAPGNNIPTDQGGTGPNKGSPGKPNKAKPKTGGKGVPGSEETSPEEGENGAGEVVPEEQGPKGKKGHRAHKKRPKKPKKPKSKAGGKGVQGSDDTAPEEGENGAGGTMPGEETSPSKTHWDGSGHGTMKGNGSPKTGEEGNGELTPEDTEGSKQGGKGRPKIIPHDSSSEGDMTNPDDWANGEYPHNVGSNGESIEPLNPNGSPKPGKNKGQGPSYKPGGSIVWGDSSGSEAEGGFELEKGQGGIEEDANGGAGENAREKTGKGQVGTSWKTAKLTPKSNAKYVITCQPNSIALTFTFVKTFVGRIYNKDASCVKKVHNEKTIKWVIPHDRCGSHGVNGVYKNDLTIEYPEDMFPGYVNKLAFYYSCSYGIVSKVTHKLLPRPKINLKCGDKQFLLRLHFSKPFEGSLYTQDPACHVNGHGQTDLTLNVDRDKCGTIKENNDYKNTLTIKYASGEIQTTRMFCRYTTYTIPAKKIVYPKTVDQKCRVDGFDLKFTFEPKFSGKIFVRGNENVKGCSQDFNSQSKANVDYVYTVCNAIARNATHSAATVDLRYQNDPHIRTYTFYCFSVPCDATCSPGAKNILKGSFKRI